MAKQKIIDVREQIYNKMEAEGRTLAWLSKMTEINYHTLYSCLKRKIFDLTPENLALINDALETEFALA